MSTVGSCGRLPVMALTENDLKAIQLLMKQEVESGLEPFREEVNSRFDQITTQIDGLYKRDETREQEYLVLRQ